MRLHAFTFASNHFHLLVWARGAALASFMQYLRANLSRKVGRLVEWSGGFWERRYSAEPVLDDAALVGRLRYVLAHGVKEGLVERSAEWPGLTCLPHCWARLGGCFSGSTRRSAGARGHPLGARRSGPSVLEYERGEREAELKGAVRLSRPAPGVLGGAR